jgi:hypothetical protein
VRLPDEFTEHALAQLARERAELSSGTPVDTDWWLAQRGFRAGTTFRSPATRGNFVANLGGVEPSVDVLRALRELAPGGLYSLAELRRLISDGATLVVLPSEYEEPRPAALARLDSLGVEVRFEPADVG